jgi:hypothetical protein
MSSIRPICKCRCPPLGKSSNQRFLYRLKWAHIRLRFGLPIKPLPSHIDRQARTGDTVLVKSRETTIKSQTLSWWLGGKTTERAFFVNNKNYLTVSRKASWSEVGISWIWNSLSCFSYKKTQIYINWSRDTLPQRAWVWTLGLERRFWSIWKPRKPHSWNTAVQHETGQERTGTETSGTVIKPLD